MTLHRRLLTCMAAMLAVLTGALIVGAAPARADTPPVTTAFTATLSGTRITATLTAADGSVPAGVPVYFSFQPAGSGVTSVGDDVTDANGEVSVDSGYPDFGTTYWFDTPGDSTYAAATSNAVHISAPLTTQLHVFSNLSGMTASGVVKSLHGYTKPGMTVLLYAGTTEPTLQVGSTVTNDIGRWSVSVPPITTPTTFQAVIVSDSENTGSPSNDVPLEVSTKTTIGVAVSGGKVTVHGAVANGNGTGQPAVHVLILVAPPGASDVHSLGMVTTDAYGHYSYTGPACTAACYYEAVAQQDAVYMSSWALTGTVKAPTRLVLTAQRGRPDRLTITLTYAANHAPIANQKITIYYHYAGRTTWIGQTVVTTNRYGQAFAREQPQRGCYFTARYAGTTTVARAASTNAYLPY